MLSRSGDGDTLSLTQTSCFYVLCREEKYFSIRAFSAAQRRAAYERLGGPVCREHAGMEADQIAPWARSDKTEPANCQTLCREDNRRKGAI
jgi:hypothetical protein